MRSFSKEEYFDLVSKLTDEQYDTLDDFPNEINLISSEPPPKPKKELTIPNGIVDLTTVKKDQIKDLIFKSNTIKVYDFTIRITLFHGESSPSTGSELTVDVHLYHNIYKTPLSGKPCSMTIPFNINKDGRFKGRPWLTYFQGPNGRNIPIDVLVEIVRWIQVVKKLPAFL